MKRDLAQILAELSTTVGGEFILIECGPDAKPVYDHRGELLRFADGRGAAETAVKLSRDRGCKIQPRRLVDNSWRDREVKRVKDGTYTLLPWHNEKWWVQVSEKMPEHFPHVSVNKQAFVAFTESAEKGSADIQTLLRPGRYLERFYSEHLNKYVIRDLSSVFSKCFEDNILQFADTEEEIEEVYLTGPNSCMSKETTGFQTRGVHPCRAYAAGDLAVAYLRRGGKIVARTIVWPDKKIFNTVYGDRDRLIPMLKKDGYKEGSASFSGAKLKRIVKIDPKRDDLYSFIVPHVDNYTYVKDHGDYLTLADKGIKIQSGAGLTEPRGLKCMVCNTDCGSDFLCVSDDADTQRELCSKCVEKNTVTCSQTGSRVWKEIAIKLDYPKGSWVHRRYKAATVKCDGSGDLMMRSSAVRANGGKVWTPEYWKSKGKCACASCGRAVETAGVKCEACNSMTPSTNPTSYYAFTTASNSW